jgi:hypothetical protein
MLPSDRDTHDGSPSGRAGSRKKNFTMFLSRQIHAMVPRRPRAVFSQWGHAPTREEFWWLALFFTMGTRAMEGRAASLRFFFTERKTDREIWDGCLCGHVACLENWYRDCKWVFSI